MYYLLLFVAFFVAFFAVGFGPDFVGWKFSTSLLNRKILPLIFTVLNLPFATSRTIA